MCWVARHITELGIGVHVRLSDTLLFMIRSTCSPPSTFLLYNSELCWNCNGDRAMAFLAPIFDYELQPGLMK